MKNIEGVDVVQKAGSLGLYDLQVYRCECLKLLIHRSDDAQSLHFFFEP